MRYQCRGKNEYLVTLLYKKGSKKNPGNYRGISILNRLFVVILNRIIHDELREPQNTLLAKV